LVTSGLDHRQAELAVREKFAFTKEKTALSLSALVNSGAVDGAVIISTCNRTELYATVRHGSGFEPARALCEMVDVDYAPYAMYLSTWAGEAAIEHLSRVASGLDSQILGDDQIITQTREALEFSRSQSCTDSYTERIFNIAIQAAKAIKTEVILKTLGTGSAPENAVAKLKTYFPMKDRKAVVIGNGQMGRLASDLLIREGVQVTVTLREYKKGVVVVPKGADTINYSRRYEAIEQADVVISATTSPHYTLRQEELSELKRLPEVVVDLAIPRDVEPSVGELPGLTLLTIDDIAGEGRTLPPDSVAKAESIIAEHIVKYDRWRAYKEGAAINEAGVTA